MTAADKITQEWYIAQPPQDRTRPQDPPAVSLFRLVELIRSAIEE